MTRDEIQREIEVIKRRIANKTKLKNSNHTMVDDLPSFLTNLDNEIRELETEKRGWEERLKRSNGSDKNGNSVHITLKRRKIYTPS